MAEIEKDAVGTPDSVPSSSLFLQLVGVAGREGSWPKIPLQLDGAEGAPSVGVVVLVSNLLPRMVVSFLSPEVFKQPETSAGQVSLLSPLMARFSELKIAWLQVTPHPLYPSPAWGNPANFSCGAASPLAASGAPPLGCGGGG